MLGFGCLEYLEQLHCHLQIADVEAFIQVPMQAAGEGGVNGVDALHMAGQFAYLSQNGLESCLGVCQPGLASHARGLLDQLEGRADAVELIELNPGGAAIPAAAKQTDQPDGPGGVCVWGGGRHWGHL